jgi:hypothetical protein
MADGYAVQRELIELLLADGDRVIGHKVGLTSAPMQRTVGVDSPDHGPVLASTVYRDAEQGNRGPDREPPDLSALIQPRCEPEIVFLLGRDLAGPHVTAADVLSASAGVAVGIEVLDSRYRYYRFTITAAVRSGRAMWSSRPSTGWAPWIWPAARERSRARTRRGTHDPRTKEHPCHSSRSHSPEVGRPSSSPPSGRPSPLRCTSRSAPRRRTSGWW